MMCPSSMTLTMGWTRNDRIDQRNLGNGKLCVVAFACVGGEIHNCDIGFRPGSAGAIKHFTVSALAKHINSIGHFQQPCAANIRQACIFSEFAQGVAHMASEDWLLCVMAVLCRYPKCWWLIAHDNSQAIDVPNCGS
jgi:hypothetical protein